MEKMRFITALQIVILLYLVITSKSTHAKSANQNLVATASTYKAFKLNQGSIKVAKTLTSDKEEPQQYNIGVK